MTDRDLVLVIEDCILKYGPEAAFWMVARAVPRSKKEKWRTCLCTTAFVIAPSSDYGDKFPIKLPNGKKSAAALNAALNRTGHHTAADMVHELLISVN